MRISQYKAHLLTWAIAMLLLQILAVTVCGRTPGEASAVRLDAPFADSDDWVDLSPKSEEFTVSIPKNGFNDQTKRSRNSHRGRYFSKTENASFYVFSDNEIAASPLLKVIDFALKNAAENNEVNLDGYSGWEFSFSEHKTFHHRFRLFITKKRVYVFYALGKTADSSDSERFLDSVSLGRELEAAELGQSYGLADFIDERKQLLPIARDYEAPISINHNPNAPSRNNTDRLLITGHSRPGYTDLARIFDIDGTVIVAVLFRSDGTIGEVRIIQPLPFGLTESASRAARHMVFLPPERDGKPFSVFKSVHFNFAIY